MRRHKHLIWLVVMLLPVAACGSDETAEDDTPTTTAAVSTTVGAPETTEPVAAAEEAAPTVDMALAPAFVADIRDRWARAERSYDGSMPDLSDDEITALGVSVCEHLGVHPLPGWDAPDEERMQAYSEAAAMIAEALGISYDPAALDAGFASEFDAWIVRAFQYVAVDDIDHPLCPIQFGPDSPPCATPGYPQCNLFYKPWDPRASAQDG